MDRDIDVYDIGGGKVISSIVPPASDRSPFWSADGKMIIYTSNRTGSTDLYGQSVAEGIVHGEPVLLKGDLGGEILLGVTRDDRLFFNTFESRRDVVSALIDLSSGAVLRNKEKITQSFEGHNESPVLSVDGRAVAFSDPEPRNRFHRSRYDRCPLAANG